MRVTILGHTGSGKTTLANAISKQYGIPHIQIDRFWFKHGGNKLRPNDNWEPVRKLIRQDTLKAIRQKDWVCDGVYRRVQPEILKRADVAIFLDVSLPQRLRNHAVRIFKDSRHPELKRREDVAHFWTMIKKTPKHRSTIQKTLSGFPNVIVLQSSREITHFRKGLPESLDAFYQKFHGKRT